MPAARQRTAAGRRGGRPRGDVGRVAELPDGERSEMRAVLRDARGHVVPVAAGLDHVAGLRGLANGTVRYAEKLAQGGGGKWCTVHLFRLGLGGGGGGGGIQGRAR